MQFSQSETSWTPFLQETKSVFFEQIPLIFFQCHPIFVHGSLLFVPSVPHGFYMCFLVFAICFLSYLSFSIVSQGIFLCFLMCLTYLIISSKVSPIFHYFSHLCEDFPHIFQIFSVFPQIFPRLSKVQRLVRRPGAAVLHDDGRARPGRRAERLRTGGEVAMGRGALEMRSSWSMVYIIS